MIKRQHISDRSAKRPLGTVLAALFLGIFLAVPSCTPLPDAGGDVPEDAVLPDEGTIEEDAQNTDDALPDETLPEETAAAFETLPCADYGGRSFLIASTEPAFVDSETSGGIINTLLYERKKALEEKYNVKVETQTGEVTTIQLFMQAAEKAGTPYCDLLYIPMNGIANYAGHGLVMNLYSVPYLDLDAPWFSSAGVEKLTIADTTYGLYGDPAFTDRSLWCTYFNRGVIRELGLRDPYELAFSGEWTWDAFLEYASAGVADLDGNGRMQYGADRYGYSSSMNTTSLPDAVFASFDKTFFSTDEEGFPKVDWNVTEENDFVSKIRSLCVGQKSLYPVTSPGQGALDAFGAGRLVFFCEKLAYVSTLADAGIDWGILPMPKLDASQEHYGSWLDSSVCGYAVPQYVADTACSGKILNALYAYGGAADTVTDAWTYYYLPDNDAARSLKLITENPVCDLTYAFGEGYPDFAMASNELLQSVVEKNVNFDYLYTQSEAPFSAFVRKKFVN